MNQSLYIFVTSKRPDQYVNPIVHCLLYKGIRKVVFLHIKGLEGEAPSDSERGISLAVFLQVQSLLDDLSKGFYRFFAGHKDGNKMINLQDMYPGRLNLIKATYKQCLDMKVEWGYRDINYWDLREELARISKEEPGSIFDVTSIRKSHLGDILTCCIIEGIHSLYTFDLKIQPNFDEPWTMLFHELRTDNLEKSHYRYTNIVDTSIFKACSNSILVRTPPIKISLLVAAVLLLVVLGVYFHFGEVNWFVQLAYIISAIASLLSLYLTFFPPRR